MIQACGSSHGGAERGPSCVGVRSCAGVYWSSPSDDFKHSHQPPPERQERQEYCYLSSRDAFSRRAFRHRNHSGPGSHSRWQAAVPDAEVRGVPAPTTATTTQYGRRLPMPTASPKGPSDSCRVVGVPPRAQLDAAERRAAPGMAAVLASARGCDRGPQPLQGSATPEASLRVQRALLKLELPEWFRQHYRPPRRDHWLGDDAAQWPKWRALPGKDAKQPAGLRPSQTAETSLPADRRNLVIPKRVTFRDKGSSRSAVRPWVYRSLRTPYLGWRSAGPATTAAVQQQAAVR
ncbi:uncharacterized protein [Dermacentor albipictus]|uniref:uncharacterized protein isoform X1 n=1 Tax=Dermacentor albipictus TaxID=60249 RepID=UPI0038FCEB03